MIDTKDQVEETRESGDVSKVSEEKKEEDAKELSKDTKPSSKRRSNLEEEEVKPGSESKVYSVLGRDMTSDELYDEYRKTQAYITKLQQGAAEREAKTKTDTSIADSELLEGIDPAVKEAIIKIVNPVLEERLAQQERKSQEQTRDEAYKRRLGELESKYKGGDGLPKFDRVAVLTAMQEPGNEVFDPELKFVSMHKRVFDDHLIKQALKDKKGGPVTESTTGSAPKKPEGKTPTTWDEASKSAFARF